MLAPGQHHTSNCNSVERTDRLAYDSEGIVSHCPVGYDVVRPDEVEIVDLAARHELVDLDGQRRPTVAGKHDFRERRRHHH